jgi:hypothetical protein
MGAGEDRGGGIAHGDLAGQVQTHAVHVGLVGDVGGGQLDHHRVAAGKGARSSAASSGSRANASGASGMP